MKPRTAVLSALALVALACAAYFLISGNPAAIEPHSQQGVAQDAPASEIAATTPVPGAGSDSAPQPVSEKEWEAIMERMSSGLTTQPVAEADVLRFLAAKGETPANVIAAWLCTRNEKWLDRALELYPKDPMILFAKLGSGAAAKLDPDIIRRFNEAAPDNPLPKIFEAHHSFSSGDKPLALEAIKEALKRPGFYTWMNESTDASRALYEFTGVPPVVADLASTFQTTMSHLSVTRGVAKEMMEVFHASASNGEDPVLVRMTYELGRMFATPEASRTLIGQMVGFSMEKRALEALPADKKLDWLPISPNARIAEIDARRGSIPDAVANSEWLFAQKDVTMLTQYLKRYRGEGEMAAIQWLAGQRAAAAGR